MKETRAKGDEFTILKQTVNTSMEENIDLSILMNILLPKTGAMYVYML